MTTTKEFNTYEEAVEEVCKKYSDQIVSASLVADGIYSFNMLDGDTRFYHICYFVKRKRGRTVRTPYPVENKNVVSIEIETPNQFYDKVCLLFQCQKLVAEVKEKKKLDKYFTQVEYLKYKKDNNDTNQCN